MFGISTIIMMIMLTVSKKDEAAINFNQVNNAPLSIEFDNIVGGQDLQLNTGSYTNAAGDSFSVSLLQYFISNIRLIKEDGSEYMVPQDSSYFLIRENDRDTRFARVNVPEGDYTSLSFVLGVDSLRSTMDISQRKGVLDPSGGMDGMYWGWNSGYIFFKLEGISPQAPLDPGGQHKFRYHIGGFGGYSAPTINNIRTVTLDLNPGGIAKVRSGRKSNIHLKVDIAQAFAATTRVSIAANSTVMFSAFSASIADNYTTMFRHDRTEN